MTSFNRGRLQRVLPNMSVWFKLVLQDKQWLVCQSIIAIGNYRDAVALCYAKMRDLTIASSASG
jgi:hypothetical protein